LKLLCFQVDGFRWKTFEKTVPEAPDIDVESSVGEALVAFVHAERSDNSEERAASVRRQTLKHLKWLANKRELKTIVLHSFTHLGGDSAEPGDAAALLEEIRERLENTGYEVHVTGESLAKVWKEIS
jgi:hypothetical protein